MALETGTYISDLVSTNPVGTDTLDKADDHLRLIKSTLQATFPNITGAVTPTHTDLNKLTSTGNPQFATIELGAATDTTISRVSAGLIAVEGGNVPLENRANTFTAVQTVSTGAATSSVTLNANAAQSKLIQAQSAGVLRWAYGSNNTAESGSNAGSDFLINRYNDAGTLLGTPVTVSRATGLTTLESLSVPTIDVGNTDTTISRVSAGLIAVEGANVPLENRANTFSALQTISSGGLTVSGGNALVTGSGGLGYGTGSGGSVTQLTSKSTAVTLNKTNGAITMNGATLGNATNVTFSLTNSTIAASDLVIVNTQNGAAAGDYQVWASNASAGGVSITLRNVSGGSLSNAVVINFAVVKAVTA